MRLAVRTEELTATARQLQDAAGAVGRLAAGLHGQRPAVGTWASGRARTAADAFVATLADGVATTSAQLADLALRTTFAADEYADAEASALAHAR
ncbi:hypothetical protein [Kineococcus siccus]|uniref:hypothetical protein n=1 Tax=Kineococcus siccus TaxID=2696567 RepID=UPI00196ABCB7|nr:hypothetical protein [Kineococcus siccus]